MSIYKTKHDNENNKIVEYPSSPNNKLYEIVPILYSFRQQLHIYHLQTESYARHKASDELLGNLTDYIDTTIETYSGKYGRVKFSGPTNIVVDNLNDDHGMSLLDNMIKYFLNEFPKYLDSKVDSDLLNLRDDIVGKINQTKYLYTLK
jgi:hypothetical protein